MRYPGTNQRWSQLVVSILLTAAVILSFRYLQLDLSGLLDAAALTQMADYGRQFLRPDTSTAHLLAIGRGAAETLAISLTGTLLAALVGIVLALPAAGRQGHSSRNLTRNLARLLLNALRSVPELVWAALMVLAAGLGPNAGTLALALHTTGVLGRLFAEALENAPVAPAQSLTLAGSGRFTAFCYGTLPLVWPQLVAYSLYRWENNIRMAAILGFVGAGGLGQMLYVHLSLFQEARAATVILAMLLLVVAVDSLSAVIRGRWVRS